MAEKKKTTPAKKTTAKKAVAKKVTPKKKVVAKKTAVKKTAPKKTTKKATTAPKKVVAKKTTTKKAAPKKKAPRVMETVKKSVIDFSTWKNLVNQTFAAFPSLWWRMGVVTVFVVLSVLALLAISFGALVLIVGGMSGLESEYLNLVAGTPNLGLIWAVGGLAIIFTILLFALSFIGNISVLLTVKNYNHKKPNNPFQVFFRQATPFLGSYAFMSLRVFWYIFWPLLLIIAAALTTTVAIGLAGVDTESTTIAIVAVAVILGVGLLILRAVQSVFAYAATIEGGKASKPTFATALSIVKGNWWLTFGSVVLFFVPLLIVQWIFDENGTQYTEARIAINPSLAQTLVDITSVLFSLFVFTPLSAAFIYILMLHLSKTKKIKL